MRLWKVNRRVCAAPMAGTASIRSGMVAANMMGLSRALRAVAPWAMLLALGLSLNRAPAATRWNSNEPDRIRIDSIVVGDTRYRDVVATFADLLGYSTGAATRTFDRFDAASGTLHIATLSALGQIFPDVRVRLSGVVSVGSASTLTDFIPNDPHFSEQWHLRNTGQAGRNGQRGNVGEDLNASPAWNFSTGTGVQIAIVDDGLDIFHEDLRSVPGKSWDYRINAYGDPSSSNGAHGTACAGLAAAKGDNATGVIGVAFNARVVGYNLLAASTDEFASDALTKDLSSNHIYSNSYGATDGAGTLADSDEVWRQAIETGLLTGRGGKGAIYTWAAGNGAPFDRSDYDGQANFRGVLAIAALNDQGQAASYSEPGANLLVSGFGGEACSSHTVTTTDITAGAGYNDGRNVGFDLAGQANYTRCMNGTSAAAPQAAGVVALMLEANPELGWRDVRAILAATARKNDPQHGDWVNNGAGWHINHAYGYGAMDAHAAVATAQRWTVLPPQKSATVAAARTLAMPIPDDGKVISATVKLAASGIRQLEFVDLTVALDHPEMGDLDIVLTSPAGTTSTVSLAHACKDPDNGATVTCGRAPANGFRFGIARLMGEPADGVWTLSVRDAGLGNSGVLLAWQLALYGH